MFNKTVDQYLDIDLKKSYISLFLVRQRAIRKIYRSVSSFLFNSSISIKFLLFVREILRNFFFYIYIGKRLLMKFSKEVRSFIKFRYCFDVIMQTR